MTNQCTTEITADTPVDATNAPLQRKTTTLKKILLRIAQIAGVGAVGFVIGVASAKQGASIAAVQARLTQSIAGRVPIDSVRTTPTAGLYEVQSGGDIFYSDASGKFVILDGRLMDLEKKLDLTKASIDRASAINFTTDLPLHLAIKEVKGTGRRVMAVFEDPACSSCRILHRQISQLDDVTIYHFMYPVIDPEGAPIKIKTTMCAPEANRAEIWNTFMDGGQVEGDMNCDASAIAKIMETGKKLNIHNTPTVFLQSGLRLVGALPPDQFVAALDEAVPR